MAKRVTMIFEFEDDEYDEFLAREDVDDDMYQWVQGEMVSNQGFGYLSSFGVEEIDEDGDVVGEVA